MQTLVRVTAAEALHGRVVRVTLSDGLVRELDLSGMLTGVLGVLDDDARFSTVGVDQVSGTVCWPGGIDLEPAVLHGDFAAASGFVHDSFASTGCNPRPERPNPGLGTP